MRTESSRRFGISCSKPEFLFSVFLCILIAGMVGYVLRSHSIMICLSAMAGATICMLSVLSSYRMAVPFLLGISYADMLRIRWPFRVWTVCVFFLLGFSNPFIELFSNLQMLTFQAVLSVVMVGQGLEYFRKGRLWHLFVSFSLAGVSVGLSVFGLCALFILLAVSFFFNRGLFISVGRGDWISDECTKRILERVGDPTSKTMARMVAFFCFFVGVLVVVVGKLTGAGKASDIFDSMWMSGLSLDGVAILVVVGVVPLIFALRGIGKSTDTMVSIGIENQAKYILVSCVEIVLLLLGDEVFVRLSVPIVADSCYWLLGMVLGGFALLMSVTA